MKNFYKGLKMDVNVKSVLVNFIVVKIEEDSSDIVQDIKKDDIDNLESYRIDTALKYILYFKELNGSVKSLDITPFLKKTFNVQGIKVRKEKAILSTKPLSKQLMLDKILEEDSVRYQVNTQDERTVEWVKQIKILFGFIGLNFIKKA